MSQDCIDKAKCSWLVADDAGGHGAELAAGGGQGSDSQGGSPHHFPQRHHRSLEPDQGERDVGEAERGGAQQFEGYGHRSVMLAKWSVTRFITLTYTNIVVYIYKSSLEMQ